MEEINENLKKELKKILEENKNIQDIVTNTITSLYKSGKIEGELKEEELEELCYSIILEALNKVKNNE